MPYGVTLNGQTFPDFNLTFNLTGLAKDTDVDSLIGLAVTQDTSAANSVKLAEDGGKIIGRIFLVEDRTSQGGGIVATIETCGGMTLPYKTAPSIGDIVEGAGDGFVKTSSSESGPRVWEVLDGKVVVLL